MKIIYRGTTGVVPLLGHLVQGQIYEKPDALVARLIEEGKAEEAPQTKPVKRAAPTNEEK